MTDNHTNCAPMAVPARVAASCVDDSYCFLLIALFCSSFLNFESPFVFLMSNTPVSALSGAPSPPIPVQKTKGHCRKEIRRHVRRTHCFMHARLLTYLLMLNAFARVPSNTCDKYPNAFYSHGIVERHGGDF